MPLLNYTTEIPASRSIAEITRMLTEGGASAIMLENGAEREIVAISFMLQTSFGKVPYTMPANVAAVSLAINAEIRSESEKIKAKKQRVRRIPFRLYNDKAQAERIAWRIAKDWLEAQLALASIGSAKLEQVMLPYATVDGKNFYQYMVERGSLLLMPAGQTPEIIVNP